MTEAIGKCNRIVHNAGSPDATVYLYDTIAKKWSKDTDRPFAEAIASLKDVTVIKVRISSNGGSAFQGLQMYNALKDHPAKIITYNDGVALSAATLPLMAGDEIHLAENSLTMIHQGRSDDGGTAAELRSNAEMLDSVNESAVKIYADRTGLPLDQVRSMVMSTTWMKATEAKAKGFATHIDPNKAVSAHCDLTIYNDVPDWAREVVMEMKEPEMSTTTTPANSDTVTMGKAELEKLVKGAVTDAVNLAVPAAVEGANARYRDITAVCSMAGHPELAEKFLTDPKASADDARKTLFEQMCKDRQAAGDGGPEPESKGGKDPDAAFKKEYKDNEPSMKENGISEKDYIESRRRTVSID